jgi:hypothetical protein
MDRLNTARDIDARYHLAKTFGLMMTSEGAAHAWKEHQQIREALVARHGPRPEVMSDQQWMDAVARIHRKMQQAGLVKPDSGVMN